MSAAARPSSAAEAVAARVARHGPLRFDEVMDLALYEPRGGFYATGGAAGRRGDFITSPEVGPLFGLLVARALDNVWHDLGRPDPFVVVEAGAGVGTLTRSVSAAGPACAPALTYVLVERSAGLRARHGDHLSLVEPAQAFPPGVDDDERPPAALDQGTGPRFVSLGELPALRFTGVVLANELLDNLAFRLVERRGSAWSEVRVEGSGSPVELVEQLVPADDELAGLADRLAPGAGEGARIPVQGEAARWLQAALSLLERGRVIAFDYASTTAEMAARPVGDWLRTYRGHDRGVGPLDDLGEQDITCEVAVDQLARVRPPTFDRSQAEFLAGLGIEGLVDEGRRIWHERAHVGDLQAVRGRSRVRESEALLDPSGLGAFRVLEWVV